MKISTTSGLLSRRSTCALLLLGYTAGGPVRAQDDLSTEVIEARKPAVPAIPAETTQEAAKVESITAAPDVAGVGGAQDETKPATAISESTSASPEAPGVAAKRKLTREQLIEEVRALVNSSEVLNEPRTVKLAGKSAPARAKPGELAGQPAGGALEESDAVTLISRQDLSSGERADSPDSDQAYVVDLTATPVGLEPIDPSPVGRLTSSGDWFSRKKLTISLDADAIYDDNIFFDEKDEVEDMIYVFRPSIEYSIGDYDEREGSYASIFYSPEAIFFQETSGQDNLDHHARLEYGGRFQRLAYSLKGEYERLSGATPDIGTRADRDLYGVEVGLTYDLSARAGVHNVLSWNSEDYVDNIDNEQWTEELFVEYNVTPKTRLGVGGAVGQLRVDGAEKQDFQQALVKVESDVTAKLTARLKGGVEFRQSGAGSRATPVFGAGLRYTPRPGTMLDLAAERKTTASTFLAGQNIESTGVSLGFTQRLGERFSFHLLTGYESSEYRGAVSGAVATRSDDYFFVRPSVRYAFRDDYRLELFYFHRNNDSTEDRSQFVGNQIGISAGHDF